MSNATVTANVQPLDYFFRGAFSIDIAIFTFDDGIIKVLLQEKDEEPYSGKWGLMGKLILPNEETNVALDNFLLAQIGTADFYKKQLRAFDQVNRHPLGRVMTIAYYGLVAPATIDISGNSKLKWFAISAVPELSFDHSQIFTFILYRLKKGLLRHPNVFELLPEEFTIPEIIAIYEQAFETKLDRPNFSRDIKASELVKPLYKHRKHGRQNGRPPQLYTFDKKKYKRHLADHIKFNF